MRRETDKLGVEIHRGATVRMTVHGQDYYGTVLMPPNPIRNVKARVVWHPEFGTWEEGSDLTVIDFLAMAR